MPKVSFRRRSVAVIRNTRDRLFHASTLDQSQQTPYQVIDDLGIMQLRYYPPTDGQTSDKQVLVIVPPLAVNMSIYDLFPERSLVAALRDAGHPLYLIDWGKPSRKQAHYRFKTYLTEFIPAMLKKIRQHSGQQALSLHGWSMGAIFCYSYAALGDKHIDKMVLLGPPCDYLAAGPNAWQNRLISKQLRALHKRTGWGVHKSANAIWHVPGWANALGFKLMSPAGTVRGYVELARRMDDREFVSAHATNAAFLDGMVAYPGGVMQDVLQFLISDNVLAHGKLPIHQCDAHLRDVRAKVLIVVGDKDPIITPAASKQLIAQMSQAQCTLLEAPGGHMSIVSGSQAPTTIWPRVINWLGST
ncbi:MAG: alpha/beta fold hydrolase [Oceanococcus sp.]